METILLSHHNLHVIVRNGDGVGDHADLVGGKGRRGLPIHHVVLNCVQRETKTIRQRGQRLEERGEDGPHDR